MTFIGFLRWNYLATFEMILYLCYNISIYSKNLILMQNCIFIQNIMKFCIKMLGKVWDYLNDFPPPHTLLSHIKVKLYLVEKNIIFITSLFKSKSVAQKLIMYVIRINIRIKVYPNLFSHSWIKIVSNLQSELIMIPIQLRLRIYWLKIVIYFNICN